MRTLSLALVAALAAPSLSAQDEPAKSANTAKTAVDFQKQIQPILQAHCVKCHGAKKQEGDLRLDLRKFVFHDDKDLWSVVPGDADGSVLIERIELPADDPDVMPAEGEKLTPEQIALLRTWITEGAEWPEAADKALLELEARRRAREVIEIPALSDAETTAETAALDAVRKRGALAMRIAANTIAVEANFSLLGAQVTDADVATLRGLEPTLVWLNLSRTAISDAALAELGRFKRLRRLNLANTKITDAGVAQLAALDGLEYLNLYGTGVTDAGLAPLQKLPALEKLYVWQTGVTPEGAAALAASVPGLTIDIGQAAAAMLAESNPAPINTECPVSGKPVDTAVTSEVDGKLVAFCCKDCKAKFDADPAAFKAKLGLAEAAPKPINTTCPVSGKPVDPAVTSEFDGKLVAFCCTNCKAKFDADPAAFKAKLGK